MRLITRCPACGTLFKVVPDQLRISEGWVRCGHCADVFDATAHMQADAAPDRSEPEVDPPRAHVLQRESVQEESESQSDAFASSLHTEVGESSAFEPPDSSQLEAEALALMEDPLDRPFELRRPDDTGEAEISRLRDSISELPSDEPLASEPSAQPALHEVSFVRDAHRNAYWARPRVRATLVLVALMLGSLLALQLAVHERDRLAAAQPALQPWLTRLCRPLDCRVGPPREIDAIAIDSSSFNKLRGEDAYRLNVTLRNQALTQVAMPALELTLTDGQDQPVVRRVLLPAEFASAANVIAAASEWSASIPLAVAADGSSTRIAGYRLLAFYP
jgi:predicted Zn finger-like uncharacterized protein